MSAAALMFVRGRLLGATDPVEATLRATPYLGAGTIALMAALLLLKVIFYLPRAVILLITPTMLSVIQREITLFYNYC
jgi:hypothetical protein